MLVGVARKVPTVSREFWEATSLEATRRWLFCFPGQRVRPDSGVDSQVDSVVHPVGRRQRR
jgi:hypothetical protein